MRLGDSLSYAGTNSKANGRTDRQPDAATHFNTIFSAVRKNQRGGVERCMMYALYDCMAVEALQLL